MTWEGLTPPYRTIVVDPPWRYDGGWPEFGDRAGIEHRRRPLPYSAMSVEEIGALTVGDLAGRSAHLYLWTTNRYLRDSFAIVEGWGFRFSQVLVWCKPPMGIGPGGTFAQTTEYVLFARRGSAPKPKRQASCWWQWPRGAHSVKPAAFADVVELVSPGPYVELFARQPRFGWDSWGNGYEELAG